MKQRWLKSVISLGLTIVLASGLCACAGRESSSEKENVSAALAKENVYQVNSMNILPWVPSEDGYITVQNTRLTEEGICAILELKDRRAGKMYYGVLTADGELSSVHINTLELLEDAQEASDEMKMDLGEVRYSNFTATSDKRVYGLRDCTYFMNDESIGESKEEQRTEICCWDDSGRMVWILEIADMLEDEEDAQNLNVVSIHADSDGSLNLLLTGENAYRIRVSKEGEFSDRVRLSDKSAALISDCFGMWFREDGSVRVMYPDDKDQEKTYLVDYHLDTDTIGEPYELPLTYVWGTYEKMVAGSVSDLIYTDMDGIFIYNIGDEQGTPRMNYVNSCLDVTSVEALMEMDTERFAVFYREYGQGLKVGIFSYVKPEDVAERRVIVLGGSSIDEMLRRRVVAFNRASDTYKIVLKEYERDEYSHSYLQLSKDIVSGNMPDILVTEGLRDEIENYIEKGLVADLYPLIEQDAELSKEDFFENVFEAYSVDGRLMYVVPSFMVTTVVAKTSLVGDGSDWSLEKAEQILAEMGNETQFMSEMTRDRFLEEAMYFCGKDFIDTETGRCAFDSEEFIVLMKFAATLPEEIDAESLYEGDYWEGYEAQYRDNRTLLMELYIDGINRNLSYELNGYMGEDYTFIGFPAVSSEKIGSDGKTNSAYIGSNDLMVLSAESENLEGAWEFARQYLTDEYQWSLEWGMPVNRRIFMEQAQELTERPFRLDENGVKVEFDNTLYYHGEEVPVPPMTQEQLERLVVHLESVKTTAFENDSIMNIISEEMGSFFAGDKKAEEVAKLIQNRVKLYVQENK